MSSESKGLKTTIKSTGKKLLGKKGYRELVRAKHLATHAKLVRKYGNPAKGLHVIGVTGTNGKTTTSTYLFEIFKQAGYNVAVYSSTHYAFVDEFIANNTITTSENIVPILKFYEKCQEKGVTHVIQETTSQALHQFRVMGIPFEAAVLTNLTYEHMDYHGTMLHYARAKGMLFKKPGIKYQVLNRDDEWYDFFARYPAKDTKLAYGTHKDASARISNIDMTLKGTSFDLSVGKDKLSIHLQQIGEYNVHNAAAAASMAHCYDIPVKTIESALASVHDVAGRLQPVNCGQPFAVFTDYAHTPDGIIQIGKAMRAVTPGRTILVHSVYDGRDPNKWPLLGEAAAESFDMCILTDEEADTLPLHVMRDAIRSGYEKKGFTNYLEIEDRQSAIDKAMEIADPKDSVVIVPFGHLKTRSFYGKEQQWSDRDAAIRALGKLGYKKPSDKYYWHLLVLAYNYSQSLLGDKRSSSNVPAHINSTSSRPDC